MKVEVTGFWGLVHLAIAVWAIISIVQSNVTTGKKVAWSVLVLVLPVLGLIIWFLAGPRANRN